VLFRSAETVPRRTAALEQAAWRLRDRAGALVASLAVRSQAQRQLASLRVAAEELRRRRPGLLARLGDAVYTGDTAGTEEARAELRALDVEIEAKEREMATVTEATARQLEEARLRSAPTVAVTPPVPPSEPMPEPLTPPAPPTIPEPAPVPHDPPAPPQIPEPGPAPHEPPIPGEPDAPTRPA